MSDPPDARDAMDAPAVCTQARHQRAVAARAHGLAVGVVDRRGRGAVDVRDEHEALGARLHADLEALWRRHDRTLLAAERLPDRSVAVIFTTPCRTRPMRIEWRPRATVL